MNAVKKGFFPIEKELLAACRGIEHFKRYLIGSHFKIITDHKPFLSLLSNCRSTTPRLARLHLHLQGYYITLIYQSGSSNPSYCLSQNPFFLPKKSSNAKGMLIFVTDKVVLAALTYKILTEGTNDYRILKIVDNFVLGGRLTMKRNQLYSHFQVLSQIFL